ncbi:hypothetical protein [Kluyvera sp. CRP]|uniref:hypothetical protein n=1 Tax=Kluyvera sp. CRP TaxID=2873269 RepID=UPI001CC1FD3F|nr:hypothetical protein [Kluyvera sp. CRP]UAK18533.1 hypothetical protein K7B04_14440 [Kluyvera sp. CRP]
MLLSLIKLVTTAFRFFVKTKTIEKETSEEGQLEINKIEIQKNTLHWRNALGFVLTIIIAYNWLIVPVLDYFGIVVIQVPLGQLLQVLLIMVGGS